MCGIVIICYGSSWWVGIVGSLKDIVETSHQAANSPRQQPLDLIILAIIC